MVDDVEIVYIVDGTEYRDLQDEVEITDIPTNSE